MPTPTTKFTIGIKSSTSINVGERCKVTNLTSGGNIIGEFGSGNECVLHPATEWKEGDSLIAEISGRLKGSETGTISKGGAKITVTTAADTTSPAVSL